MPSMTADDDHPFDPRATSCIGMGIVAQTFWQLPGVLRSDSPHAFAALAAGCPVSPPAPGGCPAWIGQPGFGGSGELDGQVLLLGVDHTANHPSLGEYMRRAATGARNSVTLPKEGRLSGSITEIDHCCQNFSLVDGWLESEGLQRRGPVGRQRRGWSDRAM